MGYDSLHFQTMHKPFVGLLFTAIPFQFSQHPPDRETVSRWFREHTGNMALLGGHGGLVILDFDKAGMFERWAKMVGRPELIGDPRYATDILRGRNGEELSRIMSEWAAGRSREECLSILIEANIGCGPVLAPADVMDGALGLRPAFFDEVAFPGSDGVPLARAPARLSEGTAEDGRRPPLLGEHSVDVLAEYGFSVAEIDDLLRQRIVATA